MRIKLTLTIDEKVIPSAKRYAEKHKTSLSGLVENYLRTLVKKENAVEEISPKVRELMGSVKLQKDFDYKKELTKILSKKHL